MSNIAVAKINATSMPTIPNAPVKMISRKLLASFENGPTQPSCEAATRAFGQVVSTTKGGEVELA